MNYSRLCYLVIELIHRWQKLEMQSRRMSGSTSSQSSADKGNQSKSDRGRDQNKGSTTLHCKGCNRDKHTHEDCRYRAPFRTISSVPQSHAIATNFRGLWDGRTVADLAIQRWQKEEKDIRLTWGRRADGTTLPRVAPNAAVPPAPPRRDDMDDRDPQRRRDHGRRDRDGDRRDQGGRATKTKKRPVSPVSSLTWLATEVALISMPSIHAQLYHVLHCLTRVLIPRLLTGR